jgi:hypothetical protein
MAFSQLASLVLACTPLAAGNGNTDLVMLRPFVVTSVDTVVTASDAGATLTLSRAAVSAPSSFATLTDAIAFAAAGLTARATTLTNAQRTFATGDILRMIIASGSTTANGVAYVTILPSAVP